MASSESDEPATTGTLPSPPSFRFENNNMSTQSLLSAGGSGYESQYGSLFGSRFSLTDGSGIFVSSLALTIIISAAAIVGIVLVTVIITLAVMLSSCEQHSALNFAKPGVADYCPSFQLNVELNNLQGWTVPPMCKNHISKYLYGGQYLRDFDTTVQSARRYLESLKPNHAERYTLVLDIDETAMSNLQNAKNHDYGSADMIDPVARMNVSKAIPMVQVLNLYHDLLASDWSLVFLSERPESVRNETAQSLMEAGYRDWTALILRSEDEALLTVQSFKSRKMSELENKGFQIKCVMGDQWSDLAVVSAGARTFKLPNPMYQLF